MPEGQQGRLAPEVPPLARSARPQSHGSASHGRNNLRYERPCSIGKGFVEGIAMPRVCGFLVDGGVPGCYSQQPCVNIVARKELLEVVGRDGHRRPFLPCGGYDAHSIISLSRRLSTARRSKASLFDVKKLYLRFRTIRYKNKAMIFHAEIEGISDPLLGRLVRKVQQSQGLKSTQSIFCQKRLQPHIWPLSYTKKRLFPTLFP